MDNRWVIVVHGGCGIIGEMSAERDRRCRSTLIDSLQSAMNILKDGGDALEAVTAATVQLEDSPEFNAGNGSVFASNGIHELDAGIMDGASGRVGGVSTVKCIKNPIVAAKKVLIECQHSLLCGIGAEQFSIEHGCTIVPNTYFSTDQRRKQLEQVLAKDDASAQLDHNVVDQSAKGTVGAVALDTRRQLASACSTGGMTGKCPGRVSDSSIVGAGFLANKVMAVSMTGNGDAFIRTSAARQIADRMRFASMSLASACDNMIYDELGDQMAGVIGVDIDGNVAMPFNTPGMFRGYWRFGDIEPTVMIFK